MSVANAADPTDPGREFVDFWNDVLAPKFIRFKHVLVDGLTHHSAAILPSLPVRQGDTVLDVGCGFGDTAIQLARRVGPDGSDIGIDCCRLLGVEGHGVAQLVAREGCCREGLGRLRIPLSGRDSRAWPEAATAS